tara:strand:+ start:467 stop:949 length:483 start_codon:yes stop_codon:yes gene_type:complete
MTDHTKKIVDLDSLKKICLELREHGKKIIFTNGCFDILHSGHIHSLVEAKKNGDILIVAINSDKSVKKIKGKSRPIIHESNRSLILSCLYFVDYIIQFDEETPREIICQILPDVLIKGKDYQGKEIAGEDCLKANGKTIKLIDLVEDISTSDIVKKILKS